MRQKRPQLKSVEIRVGLRKGNGQFDEEAAGADGVACAGVGTFVP